MPDYYQRKRPAPPPPPPKGPTTETLLSQAEALTRLARTSWLTAILGSLYVWVAIAALRDIQFFLADETMTLPILNIGISPGGFFVFAPLLLFSVFIHLHLTLSKLWHVYGLLHRRGSDLGGLPVIDRVSPWMLNHVLPQPAHRGFAPLYRGVAVFFGWMFLPLTVIALSYRHLRAHDPWTTGYHAVIIGLIVVAAVEFGRDCHAKIHGAEKLRSWTMGAFAAAIVAIVFFDIGRQMVTGSRGLTGRLSFLSTNAQLFRAELSRKPPGWDSLRMKEIDARIALLEQCQDEPEGEDCTALRDKRAQGAASLKALRDERASLVTNVTPAPLGHVEASGNAVPVWRDDFCDAASLIRSAADLRGADLREAFLSSGNLLCARLDGADLRESQLFSADLRWARMEGASMAATRLDKANLTGAILNSAIIREALLHGTILERAYLVDADLSKIAAKNASFKQADLRRAKLVGANFQNATLEIAILNNTNFSFANLDFANFEHTELPGADFRYVEASRTNFSHAIFKGAVFEHSRITNGNFSRAVFEGADLRNANFQASTWTGATFKDVIAHGADFRDAIGLTQQQLEGVIGDSSTLLPTGLAPDTNRYFHVKSCFKDLPAWFDTHVARWAELLEADLFARPGRNRRENVKRLIPPLAADLRNEWQCPKGQTPRNVGTRLPGDAPSSGPNSE